MLKNAGVVEEVSIPYSSGKKCKMKTEVFEKGCLASMFQSLIHQGKNARITLPDRSVVGGTMFQSLIHQGKNARLLHPHMGCVLHWEVSIPYSSGKKCKLLCGDNKNFHRPPKFQSLIHQGKNASDSRWICLDCYGLVSIPYSSGKKCKYIPNAANPKTDGFWFQSLIHQGKNARPAFVSPLLSRGCKGKNCNPLFESFFRRIFAGL